MHLFFDPQHALLCRSIWLKKDFILNTAGRSPRPAPAIKGGTKTKKNVLVFENSTDLAQLTPNQKPFCGCWGCLASLRSCEHLPARLQPPRGWADGGRPRGLRPDHFRVPPQPPRGVAACTTDAPMWCDGGGLRGRAGRHTIGAQREDSSAPENPGEAHAVGELV